MPSYELPILLVICFMLPLCVPLVLNVYCVVKYQIAYDVEKIVSVADCRTVQVSPHPLVFFFFLFFPPKQTGLPEKTVVCFI